LGELGEPEEREYIFSNSDNLQNAWIVDYEGKIVTKYVIYSLLESVDGYLDAIYDNYMYAGKYESNRYDARTIDKYNKMANDIEDLKSMINKKKITLAKIILQYISEHFCLNDGQL